MSDTWTTEFEGEIEGRPVEAMSYSEGGYLVRTTQKEDDDGFSESDGSTMTIMPPTAKGTPIDIEGADIEELRQNLATDGNFSAAAIGEIVSKFSR